MKKLLISRRRLVVLALACCLALWLPVDAKAQSAQYNCNPCTPTHLANWLGTGILGDAGTSFSAQTQGANASQFAQISVIGIPNLYFDNLVHIRSLGAAPTATSCGTTPAVSGSDVAGTVTMGTGSPTGCTLTFSQAFLNAPNCVVTWQTNIASMQYTVTASALTLVQTATSSNKVNWFCFAGSNG